MCNVCSHVFDMQPVVGSFFVTQYIIDLEGNGTMGNQLINLFWYFLWYLLLTYVRFHSKTLVITH